MLDEVAQLREHRASLAGEEPAEVALHGLEKQRLIDDVRQADQHEDQERNSRKERVVRNRAGKEQSLVRAKRLERAQGEGTGVLEHERKIHRSQRPFWCSMRTFCGVSA